MSTFVPAGNTTVITDADQSPHHNNHQNHGYHEGTDQPYRPSERVKDSIAAALQTTDQNFGFLNVAVEKNGAAGALATEKNGAASQLATEKTGAANQLATEKTGAAGALAVEKIGAAGQLATEKTAAASQFVTRDAFAAVALGQAKGFSETQNYLISGFKDGRFDSATATAAIQQSMVNGFKDGRYDAATLTASILQSQVVGFKDGRYDAAVNTAAIQSQAASTAAIAAAAMAECCCEIKGLVTAEGTKTRERMDDIEARRNAVELTDSKNEVTLLKLQLAAKVPAAVVV
jgi:hypothetical protein